jgi:hypothetical protein
MIFASIASILLSSATATAPPTAQQNSIVVIGRAIDDNKKALASCLARNCPPDEDIDASLALAESQLIAGKYHDARATLLGALGRDKHAAMAYPVPVSDLYRANGRVAAHLGIDADYYRSTWGIYNTLRKGLPSAIDLKYSALMEVAEMMSTTRGHDTAREYYRSISYHARKDGRPDIAALAELRMIIRHFPAYARENAIRKVAESTDPKTRAAQLEARLALARIAFERNDLEAADVQLKEITSLDVKRPILVYSPTYEVAARPNSPNETVPQAKWETPLQVRVVAPDGRISFRRANSLESRGFQNFATHRMALNVEDMWVDVGFRITDQGKVADVRVLRSRGDTGWAKPLLASIAGRRYTPPAPGSSLAQRTERYTYTSGLEPGAASHSNQHSPNARIEYMDLSDIAAVN